VESTADIVLLAKRTEWSEHAISIAKILLGERLLVITGNLGDPLPELDRERYYVVLSFLSPWIVPLQLLNRSDIAINFHPGTAEYPGIGCYNFALYEGAQEYGAICHHMAPKVDTGPIIAERRFNIFPHETVESLKLRTMVTMINLYHEIVGFIASGRPLPSSDLQWAREAFTRKELESLGRISLEMSPDEIKKRVRAMTYPGFPGVKLHVGGVSFETQVPRRKPLA
jgi:methionyl-tRNA formyltransferase